MSTGKYISDQIIGARKPMWDTACITGTLCCCCCTCHSLLGPHKQKQCASRGSYAATIMPEALEAPSCWPSILGSSAASRSDRPAR